MRENDLKEYIYNYLKNNNAKSAIMLDGKWGTGKSYFIQNELTQYISKEDGYKCVIISLYGLKDVFEISQSIFWELRRIKIKNKKINKLIGNGFIAAKSVIKSFINKFGVDFSISDRDLEKIYKSIDISKVLIVLEDIERTQIDLISLLGYVNNLTDHDNAKVLLVVNEQELLKQEKINIQMKEKNTNEENDNYSEEVKQYLKEKEKTICETIRFTTDINSALINILNTFNNALLIKYTKKEHLETINNIMYLNKNSNLRSFIFACQKTVEIYSKLNNLYNEDFIDCIFFGVLSFLLKIKKGKEYNWKSGDLLSTELGCEKYPLFKFCYDYIIIQEICYDEIELTKNRLDDLRLYDDKKSKNDNDLRIIYNYFQEKEGDVREAVKNIEKKLNNINIISFYDYGKIAVYIIAISDLLEIDVGNIKNLLIENIRGRVNIIQGDTLFASTLQYEKEKLYVEYNDLKDKMYESLNCYQKNVDYDYKPENLTELKKYVRERKSQISIMGEFASKFNIPHMVELFLNSTARQMHEYRGVFLDVYQNNHIIIDYGKDKQALVLLLEGIKKYNNYNFDKIQIQQCKWFINNLEGIIQQMN